MYVVQNLDQILLTLGMPFKECSKYKKGKISPQHLIEYLAEISKKGSGKQRLFDLKFRSNTFNCCNTF